MCQSQEILRGPEIGKSCTCLGPKSSTAKRSNPYNQETSEP